ncbi:excinuclease ABC subunit C [Oryzomicrobium terrae]|uniref:UvrABC system protein C n=1 Tax=Oryzomicrobium terrae TaxID=1735038 RepID=A0A5C1E843_9RHOO|nr:excinuclease ABC subunit UvrC [Oryzomicrobium terrae]QEL65126.1 excinuclease ABC subunit C [Oryzomicrobium terrae]
MPSPETPRQSLISEEVSSNAAPDNDLQAGTSKVRAQRGDPEGGKGEGGASRDNAGAPPASLPLAEMGQPGASEALDVPGGSTESAQSTEAAVPAEPAVPFDAKTFLATVPELPGVYRMIDAADTVLYVGKAKNLRKRVSSYFQKNHPSPRIALMVTKIARVDTTVTRTEAEALLLENNLIKRLSPRYNILFRDDKSYPYIVLTRDEAPRLGFHRGSLDRKADYFGPFPSAGAVRDSLHLLQKMFRLRTCENSVFSNRSRPCLLYQIKRCSGPCVGLIDADDYREDVRLAALFLQGRQQEVIARLTRAMEQAAENLAFEQAAAYRDQIQSLHKVQDKQFMESQREEDLDVVAVVADEGGMLCVNLAMVRGGRHLGDKPLFPSNAADFTPAEALAAFLTQHYALHPIPGRILVNVAPAEGEEGEALLAEIAAIAGRPVPVGLARYETHKVWVELAEQNARLALAARRNTISLQGKRVEALAEVLGVEAIQRIECFDISHTQGEATVASCVVWMSEEGKGGMRRSEYRRFNITDITPGDDYAAIRQAVSRRYDAVATGEGVCPDLILIDGGKGQLAMAHDALVELGLTEVPHLGVAKGEGRKPGLESLVFPDGREPLQLPPEHPALHLIQEIRDEAHRFAISGHRAKRAKTRITSRLEDVPGIGPKKRKALITRFGGLQGIAEAGVDQLAAVPGIGPELAEKIHAVFH